MTMNRPDEKPADIRQLESVFGEPSQTAFGSAVFFQTGASSDSLESHAKKFYQYFCGETWQRFGPENWLANWKSCCPSTTGPIDIVSLLESLPDPGCKSSAQMLLDQPGAGPALQKSFHPSGIEEIRVFQIGDGAAMSGLLLAASRCDGRLFLTFLMD